MEYGSVYFPEDTFYKDYLMNITSTKDTLTVGSSFIPAQKFFTVTIKSDTYANEDTSKVFIARSNGGYEPTVYKDGVFTAKSRNLGKFYLRKDTIPPTLKAVNFRNGGIVKGNTLKILVSDNLTGFESCSATLNGQWILFEYEPKNRCLTFHFSDIDTTQTNRYELIVNAKDRVGNVGTLKANFTKPTTNN